MEISNTYRSRLVNSPLFRRTAVLLLAGFIAFQLGRNEVTPAVLLLVATLAAVTVAIELVPHTSRYIRKPESELDSIRAPEGRVGLKSAKQAYSLPHLKHLESRVFPAADLASSEEEEPFRSLRPFYLAYSARDFEITAACLKFDGERKYRDWQPIAMMAPEVSDLLEQAEEYQWVLIAYVSPGIRFDAKLRLYQSQLGHAFAILHDLVAFEDNPFYSIFLRTPSRGEHLSASAPD